jgi:hypothetical protein
LITTIIGGWIDAAISDTTALISVMTGAIPTLDAAWLMELTIANA